MRRIAAIALFSVALAHGIHAQDPEIAQKLTGFDAYMEKTLKDWNAPGVGVGIVVNGQLVFAKGYGYRDYEKKLPFTPTTLCPIASNTKLFTAVSAGMLVEEGKLSWDKPIRQSVPAIQFYNDELNNTVTLHDMLSHRTGITRNDTIWYKSEFSRKELFDRLKYLEPQQPIRQMFLYNNMMYMAAGYVIELQSGKPWEQFVRERILTPLAMDSTVYSIPEMVKGPDHGVPFTEKRDSFELYRIPYYEEQQGIAPAGAIISNIEDMSHWLTALMNDGKYKGRQVLPADVLKATLEPSISLPNTLGESKGYWEVLNAAYGMARETAAYRGHLITFHGGDIDGFHSQVSFLPNDHIGVIVFVIGDHCSPLYNIVSYNVYERLLGIPLTPWSERRLDMRLKDKAAAKEARAKAGADQVRGTKPSHALADYAGAYENPAYGILQIGLGDNQLRFGFHQMQFPLTQFHYDRFDTPDDERYGKWSVNFRTNPQGDVDQVVMSLDEAEAVFTRKPETADPKLLARLAGSYETPNGIKLEVVFNEATGLSLVAPGAPPFKLNLTKGLKFSTPQFSDLVIEFVMENGRVTGLKERDPSGEQTLPRKSP